MQLQAAPTKRKADEHAAAEGVVCSIAWMLMLAHIAIVMFVRRLQSGQRVPWSFKKERPDPPPLRRLA